MSRFLLRTARDATELAVLGLFLAGLSCLALGATDTIRAHRADVVADRAIAMANVEAGR